MIFSKNNRICIFQNEQDIKDFEYWEMNPVVRYSMFGLRFDLSETIYRKTKRTGHAVFVRVHKQRISYRLSEIKSYLNDELGFHFDDDTIDLFTYNEDEIVKMKLLGLIYEHT